MRYPLVLAGLLCLFSSSAGICQNEADSAQNEKGSKTQLNVSTAVMSRYIWRGLRLTDGPVFQPSVNLSKRGLSCNVWFNMDLCDANEDRCKVNEVDYTLSYDFSIKPLSCTVGGMHYTYPKTGEISSTELFLAVGLDAFMQPTVSINQDIDEAKGSYVSFSLGNELPVDFLKTQIEYSATVGWGSSNHNGYYYEVEKNAFADAGFSLEIPFTLRQWLTVTPVFSWSSLIDGQVRKSQSFDDHLFFGATLSCDL